MAPNHGGDPLGSIMGPMGSHWCQKMGQNRKKITMTQISNFWLLRGHRFGQKIELTVMAPNHSGDPLGFIVGPMGSIGAKKWVKSDKNSHAPKFQFLTTPRSSIRAKNWIYCYGANSRRGPPRVHLGANGVPLGPKNRSKSSKITMPQNSNFWLLRSHRFGSILVPMGSHWGKKNGSKP